MYFAVVKIVFESSPDPAAAPDRRELHALTEKLRARFKVCAAACATSEDAAADAIAVTALASTEERLSQTLDAIAEFCETAGFGRVESEETLLDHIDALSDYSPEGD